MTATTERAAKAGKIESESGGSSRLAGLVVPGGVVMLTAGMILVVAGVVFAPLFRPGTWLILVALLIIAAGGLVLLAGSRDA